MLESEGGSFLCWSHVCIRALYAWVISGVIASKKNLLFISYNISHCYFFFFYNQRKHSDGFWLSSKGTFTPFIDRCFVVLAGFHVTVLQYYFKDRQLLGIIPSSCSEGFPPPTASVQIHSILWKLCKDSHRWHTSCRASGFMTSLPNPSSSSVPSWLMPGSTSWCAFPRVDTRQLRSAAPHLYNSKRGGGGWGLRALLQCWKTHYVYFCQLLGSHGWGGTWFELSNITWNETPRPEGG